MAERLPREIIADILSRLAVKDLLRYRCVSKTWRSTIDGPDFIKLHLEQSLKMASRHRVVFGGRKDLYWFGLDSLDSAVQLSHPVDIGNGIDVLGSCNGLLAMGNGQGDVAIWNPSTRRYRALPLSKHKLYPFNGGVFEFVMTGFGYDPVSEDYKFTRKMNLYYKRQQGPGYTEVAIYSVKTKTWKSLDDFPEHFIYLRRGFGVPIGHNLHWVVNRKSDMSNSIIAFDLVAENHRELVLPYDNDFKMCFLKLLLLGGCLCVSVMCDYNPVNKKSGRVDVWVMKEYGIAESWIKLFSVAPPNMTGPFLYVFPVAYLNGGDSILLDQNGDKFLLYDVKRKRLKKLKGFSYRGIYDTRVCVESLVGLDFGLDDAENTRKQAAMKNKKDKEKKKNARKSDKRKKQSTKKSWDDFLAKGFNLAL